MSNTTAIDWKKNTQEYFLNQFKKEEREKGRREGIKEGIKIAEKKWLKEGKKQGIKKGIKQGKLKVALTMLRKGFSPEVIESLTNIPLAEIEKLEAQRV